MFKILIICLIFTAYKVVNTIELNVTEVNVPVCVGGFSVDPVDNLTYCDRDATGVRRVANETDCKFPAWVNGQWEDKCIYDSVNNRHWCSVERNFTNKFTICEQECPVLARLLTEGDATNPTHPMCFDRGAGVIPYPPDSSQIETLVFLHNELRKLVPVKPRGAIFEYPHAADIALMKWDDRIARLAQRVAEKGVFSHNKYNNIYDYPYETAGQNLYLTTANYYYNVYANAVKAWASEKIRFQYGNSSSAKWQNVAHYTQMVNSKVLRFGCGGAWIGSGTMIVCSYSRIQLASEVFFPYRNDTEDCTDFKPSESAALSSYCDRRVGTCDKKCFHYGILDKKTCTCQCRAYATGPECETLICDKPTDNLYGCWYPDSTSHCKYANVYYNCPWTCGICTRKYIKGKTFS